MFENVENEMGVVVYFSQVCESRGYELVSVQVAYPDAIIRSTESGKLIKVEFEYRASSFILHAHDIRKSDVVFCWINDMNNESFPLPIIEVKDPVWTITRLATESEKEVFYYKTENSKLTRVIEKLSVEIENLKETMNRNVAYSEKETALKRLQRMKYKDDMAIAVLRSIVDNIPYRIAAEETSMTHTSVMLYANDIKNICSEREIQSMYDHVVVFGNSLLTFEFEDN